MTLWLAASAGAAVTPTPLQTNPNIDESAPAATAQYEAWVQNSTAKPSHYDVYAQARAGGTPWKVNYNITYGFGPTPVAGAPLLVIYQQVSGDRAHSDLIWYNLATRTRTLPSTKVDTAAWEYSGVASTKYIAFMRLTSSARVMLLYNRSTGTVSQIASISKGCDCLWPTWIGASHLAYTQCSPTTFACQVRVRTIVGGATVTVPNSPAPWSNYNASVDETSGNVYYVHSTTYCGLFASLNRWNISGATAPAVLYNFAEGIDGNSVSLAPSTSVSGDSDLLFSQFDCIAGNDDNYLINSVNTLAALRTSAPASMPARPTAPVTRRSPGSSPTALTASN